jgi:ferrous iron transport protein B
LVDRTEAPAREGVSLTHAETTSAAPEPSSRSATRPLIVVVGNPNVGKTTLFNRLTGQRARVGNYPGVTVERRSGILRLPSRGAPKREAELVDVPGAYSLSARSAEEEIALFAALGLNGNPKPALVLLVVDAGQLTRNLYLGLQLLELEIPLVVALNMVDEAANNPPSARALEKLLGVPCVATNARLGQGLDALSETLGRSLDTPRTATPTVTYPEALEHDADRVRAALPAAWRGSPGRERALALWALTSLEDDDELEGIDPDLRAAVRDVHSAAAERDIDGEVVRSRYAFLDTHVPGVFARTAPQAKRRRASERIDRVLLHPMFGFLIFLALMFIVFQSLFSWADPAIGLVEDGIAALQGFVTAHAPDGVLRDLAVEGVLGGVGNVVVFLPQIALLFLFIGLMEDSGYMARVAFLMDRIMKSLGLHGRAFVPMLSGFACAVPAILATRTMERQRDRLLTMLVIPLMTCSARLPVYTLVIAALFPPSSYFGVPTQGLLMVAMYLFSTTIALAAAGVLGRTVVKGRRVPLILELPPYRVPSARATLRLVFDRSLVFLREAGSVILVCTIVLWALLSFPKPPEAAPNAVAAQNAPTAVQEPVSPIEYSLGGRLGKALEPALEPLGFDWKIGVGIVGAFAAREVFISTMGLVYGIGEVDEEATPLREKLKSETKADGSPAYTPLAGLSLMVFFALACQCMSTLAVVRRETRSWRWPAFLFVYMTALAYLASLLVFQGGRLLGF